MDDLLQQLREALLAFTEAPALQATQALLDRGHDPEAILQRGLSAAMSELGERWKQGHVFLPQVMVAARIFARCAALVEPALLHGRQREHADLVMLATVKGDLHDLGKSIVGAMIKVAGFQVVDLGIDVSSARIVQQVQERVPRILGLSAMLTTTMPQQAAVIEALDRAGLRHTVRVIVGGAPVNARWAEQIGADGYGANSADAVRVVQQLRTG